MLSLVISDVFFVLLTIGSLAAGEFSRDGFYCLYERIVYDNIDNIGT